MRHGSLRMVALTAGLVAVALLASTACQVNQTMWSPCAASADGNPFGADATHVLFCRDGRWEPIMTIDEYLRIRRGEWVEIAPLPSPPQNPPSDPGAQNPPQDPPSVQPPPKVVEVAAGSRHTCARFDDGSAKCWGSDDQGQLGVIGGDTYVPQPVPELRGAIGMAAGGRHTCAIDANMKAYCWGGNRYGQLGRPDNTGTDNPNPSPQPVMLNGSPLGGVVQISAGSYHTCAATFTGSVYCFGRNDQGQLGTNLNSGTSNPNPVPTLIGGLTGVTTLSASAGHTCGRLGNGTVRCWGDNRYGQLGDGTIDDRSSPVAVNPLDNARSVATGTAFTCVEMWNARARCFGLNDHGQLGSLANLGLGNPNVSPLEVTNLVDAGPISAGFDHTCTRTTTSGVKCWGSNAQGQMGSVTAVPGLNPNPAPVQGMTGIVSMDTGFDHTCAVNDTGNLWCWGSNFYGQLGRAANFGTGNANVNPMSVPL